jgi:hypothetical protein
MAPGIPDAWREKQKKYKIIKILKIGWWKKGSSPTTKRRKNLDGKTITSYKSITKKTLVLTHDKLEIAERISFQTQSNVF